MKNHKDYTGSHLVAMTLKAAGVKNIFTLAGDHVLPILDVLSEDHFNLYDTRHEQAAAHMADAYGRITGQLGVAIYTTPGFANAIPALSNAFHSESPMLSISGCAELSELGRGAMQEIDQVAMASPITKGSWMVTDPNRIPDMISHAIRVAFTGRRGPVHLTIPVDIQQMRISSTDFNSNITPTYDDHTLGTTDQIQNIVNLMQNSKSPLIILGSGASYSNTGEAFKELIDVTKFPLMTEGDSRGLVADTHPYNMGFFDLGLNKAAKMIKNADLVILMGRKQDLIIGYAMEPTIRGKTKIIQIDPDSTVIGRNRKVDIGIAGNVANITKQITQEAKKYEWVEQEWCASLRHAHASQQKELTELSKSESPMHASYVHSIINKHLSDEDILVFDGGDFCHFGRAFYKANAPKSWLYLPPSGMLGQAIPTALVAKIAHKENRVVAFTGDGAFGFNGMEFDTAVRHKIPIITIMGNDSAWGIDRHIQMGVFGKTVATDLLPSRYDQIVEALGGHGELVEHPSQLEPAIDRAFNCGLPSLVNIRIQNAISPRAAAAVNRWKSHTPEPF